MAFPEAARSLCRTRSGHPSTLPQLDLLPATVPPTLQYFLQGHPLQDDTASVRRPILHWSLAVQVRAAVNPISDRPREVTGCGPVGVPGYTQDTTEESSALSFPVYLRSCELSQVLPRFHLNAPALSASRCRPSLSLSAAAKQGKKCLIHSSGVPHRQCWTRKQNPGTKEHVVIKFGGFTEGLLKSSLKK